MEGYWLYRGHVGQGRLQPQEDVTWGGGEKGEGLSEEEDAAEGEMDYAGGG